MTLLAPTVEVYFDLSSTGGTYMTLDDPVKGELDDVLYPLAGDTATDITAYVHAVSITRGRSRELDEIQAGTCSVELRNHTGAFLPDPFGDGSVFDLINLVPGKRVTVSVEGIPIFDGLIDEWSYDYPDQFDANASFAAADALASLARKDFDEWTTDPLDTPGVRLNAILNRIEVAYPSNRSLDTGVSVLASDLVTWGSNVLNYCQLVTKSDLGRLFTSRDGVLTFKDRHALVNPSIVAAFSDGTGIPYAGIQITQGAELLYNRVSVDREGGTAQTSERATSITKYGVRTLSLGGLLLNSDAQSEDMADFLSGIYSEPQSRISGLTVLLDGLTSAQQAQVLALDLASVVSVEWTPTGMSSPVTQISVVEGVSHSSGVGSIHVVELSLSPVLQSESFVLDDTELGVLDSGVLAF